MKCTQKAQKLLTIQFFQDTIDILICWHIDTKQPNQLF